MHRRTLLVVGAAAMACRKAPSNWRFFTDDQARTVDAVVAQLIPAGPGPGAREAGVVHYIDIQLATRFRKHQKAYREGLANIDYISRKDYGKPFADLADDQQIAALNTVEERARTFFQLFLNHTRQGFYGDPRHGGNRDRVSWKLLGLPFPPVRGRAS